LAQGLGRFVFVACSCSSYSLLVSSDMEASYLALAPKAFQAISRGPTSAGRSAAAIRRPAGIKEAVENTESIPFHPSHRFSGAPARALTALLVFLGFKSSRKRLGYWRRLQARIARSKGLARAQRSLESSVQAARPVVESSTGQETDAVQAVAATQVQHHALARESSDVDPLSAVGAMATSLWESFAELFDAAVSAGQGVAVSAGEVTTSSAAAAGRAAGLAQDEATAVMKKAQESANATMKMAQAGASAALQNVEGRLMEAGTWYQNEVGTLLNDRGVPIIVSLNVTNSQHFELKVDHLNSPNGGSEGWFSFRGSFELCPQPGSGKASVLLRADNEREAFKYDTKVLERATAFAFACLKRAGGAVLSALKLELDMDTNKVIVTPEARVIRLLWWEPVVLVPTLAPTLVAAAA